ncbi:VOC family protein [Nostoc sp.]|uniref:VOC family protein n=1 Tax=Nostoc sp. TaxID=1180 RepID=UPI002FF899EE
MQGKQKVTSGFGNLLKGVNHIGVTVENIEKSLEFYTEVLGGRLIVKGTGLSGDTIHNTLLQKEELDALQLGIEYPKTIGIPNLRNGENNLNVYFVQFDNVVIELLHYTDASSGKTFTAKNPNSSPAFVNSMHIAFHLQDNIDVNDFARKFEEECQQRGLNNVRFNRTIRVPSEDERKSSDLKYNSCKFIDTSDNSVGDFDGWTLLYFKGPNGEQLEFNQVTRKAKVLFENAKEDFNKAKLSELIIC